MLLLLLLSRFSRVGLCATPQTAAHLAPLSLREVQKSMEHARIEVEANRAHVAALFGTKHVPGTSDLEVAHGDARMR